MENCPEHGCSGFMIFDAQYGAPGVGQAWHCSKGHQWSKVGGKYYPPETQMHILTEEDVR